MVLSNIHASTLGSEEHGAWRKRATFSPSSIDLKDYIELTSFKISADERDVVDSMPSISLEQNIQNVAISTWLDGWKYDIAIIAATFIFDEILFLQLHVIEYDEVNWMAIHVVASAVSFALAAIVNIATYGLKKSLVEFFSCPMLCHWGICSALMTIVRAFISSSQIRETEMYWLGFGTVYLPFTVLGNYISIRRKYGSLEHLAAGMIVLATVCFVWLRKRCNSDSCLHGTKLEERQDGSSAAANLMVAVSSACIFSVAGLLSERIYGASSSPFVVHKLKMDFWSTCLSTLIWVWTMLDTRDSMLFQRSDHWFGKWDGRHYSLVGLFVLYRWSMGLVIKQHSAVAQAVVENVASTCAYMAADGLFTGRLKPRLIPSVCLVVITMLSGYTFMYGRILLYRQLQSDRITVRSISLQSILPTRTCLEAMIHAIPLSLVLYILADASRTEMQSITLGQSMMTPQSMSVGVNTMSLIMYSTLSVGSPPDGFSRREVIRAATNPRKVMRIFPCGFLFAATNALMSMAMGLGMSASLAVVIGKVYTPICAFGSFMFLGRYYIGLEWCAIVILTASSTAFGALRNMDPAGSAAGILPMILVICSATAAASNSLVMEKIMKSDIDPFNIQKIRIDFGCLLWSVMFLPVMGWMGGTGFPRGAYWKYRPLRRYCEEGGTCQDAQFVQGSWQNESFVVGPFADEFSDCFCGRGVFVCWENPAIYAMLLINVVYNTSVGLVVKRYSSMHRAIADAFSLLLVYFIGDPLVSGRGLDALSDMPLNLVALVIPLSSQLFSLAASELKKFADAIPSSRDENGLDVARAQSEPTTKRVSNTSSLSEFEVVKSNSDVVARS